MIYTCTCNIHVQVCAHAHTHTHTHRTHTHHTHTHTHSDGDHGTIHYINLAGEPRVINFYWSAEPLQFGDQVEFSVATRSYDKLQMAVDIRVTQKAKDIRFRVRQAATVCVCACVFLLSDMTQKAKDIRFRVSRRGGRLPCKLKHNVSCKFTGASSYSLNCCRVL